MERQRSNCPASILHRLSERSTAYLRWARTSAGNNGSRAQVTISRSPSRTTRVTMAGFCAPSPSIPGQNDPSAKSSNLLITNTTSPKNSTDPPGPAGARPCAGIHISRSRNYTCAEFKTQHCINCMSHDFRELQPHIGGPTQFWQPLVQAASRVAEFLFAADLRKSPLAADQMSPRVKPMSCK